jgi:hypothetical protein
VTAREVLLNVAGRLTDDNFRHVFGLIASAPLGPRQEALKLLRDHIGMDAVHRWASAPGTTRQEIEAALRTAAESA